MRIIAIEETEFKRAFEETLLKIEKALTNKTPPYDPFRSVNYLVHELKTRLESR